MPTCDPAALRRVEVDPPAGGERLVELRDLIALRQIGIEIVLAGEDAGRGAPCSRARGRRAAPAGRLRRWAPAARPAGRGRPGRCSCWAARRTSCGSRRTSSCACFSWHVDLEADHRLPRHQRDLRVSGIERRSDAAAAASMPLVLEVRRDELAADRQAFAAADREGHRREPGEVDRRRRRCRSGTSRPGPRSSRRRLNAGVGVVGVKSRSTPEANTWRKSSAISARTCCAFS